MPSDQPEATAKVDEYVYPDASPRWDDRLIWNAVRRAIERIGAPRTRACELGCGNGVTASRLQELGFDVTAIDPSPSGIRSARAGHAGIAFHVGSVEEPLAERFGQFATVIAVEVIEHCYSPKRFAECAFELLEPGGHLILSTPYHGYLKNLALAISGRMDTHFSALWEGGHIKFFSERTITMLLRNAGFERTQIVRVGRVPPLAKSMVVVCRKP